MNIVKILNFPENAESIKYLEQDPECGQYIDKLIDETIGKVMIDVKAKKLVGYVFVYCKGKNEGFIFNLFVFPEYRGHNLGKMLAKYAVALGGRDLTVGKDNEVAIDIYEKLGFEVVGEGNTPDEYYMKLEDNYVFEV